MPRPLKHRRGKRVCAGQTSNPAYPSWAGMMSRCYNPNSHKYRLYGGRGITVCERWHNSENFFEDMGPRPPGASIDRIDVNGNYEPDNCRWATALEQRSNQRKPLVLEEHEFEQVRWLRRDLEYSCESIAAFFGISKTYVKHIAYGINERRRRAAAERQAKKIGRAA